MTAEEGPLRATDKAQGFQQPHSWHASLPEEAEGETDHSPEQTHLTII